MEYGQHIFSITIADGPMLLYGPDVSQTEVDFGS